MASAVKAAQGVGTLSVVVNVAGGATGGGRILGRDGSPADKGVFTSTMDMNAVGTFNVSRIAAAAIAGNEPDEDGQRGVIVNTASIAGLEGQTGQIAYAATKGAILGHDPADGSRPRPLRHPGLRHRPRHHGHAAHAERPRRR